MPPLPPPRAVTGDPVADRVLAGLVGLSRLLVASRLRAVYLSGSHAAGRAEPDSDLDLLVLRDGTPPDQFAVLRGVYERCGQLTPMSVDVVVCTESELRALGLGWFDGAKVLLHGDDVLAGRRPPADPAADLDLRFTAAAGILRNLYGRPLRSPLAPPDPADEFLGFARWPLRLRDGTEVPGTRALAVSASWAANAILARRGAEPAVYKDAGFADRFRDAVGPEWHPFLLAVFTRLRGDWGYRVPESPDGRAELRRLCEAAVRFHDFFLREYAEHLRAELDSGDARRADAARRALADLDAARA